MTTPMTKPLVELRGVSFGYDGSAAPILADVNLAVGSGEFIGVLGPNGAGKSTLLRIVLGIEPPDSGSVFLDGKLLNAWSPKERSRIIAAVLQEEPSAFPYSVAETVLLGRLPHTGALGFESALDLAAADEAMRATGVSELRQRSITELSGGERKRALLARALCQQPKLLALDEPAAALDIHHQIAIFEELAHRVTQGLSVIAVVHDLNLAAQFCTRLVLCRPGEPIAVGSVEEILTYRRVREAFGIDVYVGVNELTGDRFLIPMRDRPKQNPT